MRNFIQRNISGSRVILLFILTNIIYTIMLAITIPKVMAHAGGMKLLDMMPAGYSPEYVDALFSALGESGRHAYLYNQIPVDMIYPGLFGITYCLVLAYIFTKLGKLDTRLFYLCFIPVIAGLFDYFENIGIITMLNSYPSNADNWSWVTNVFSVLKSVLTTMYFIILTIALIAWAVQRIAMKRDLTQ